ncbi:MAG TPA: FHA domain-containing protein, partial [Ktedonobacteraceae bacterium]
METLNEPPALGSINFLTGSLAGSVIQIHKLVITIGREPDNDIVVTDPSVSRRHAQITLNAGAWTISNLTQKNIVIVNQQHISPLQQSSISERDTITLGAGTTFLFLPNAGAPSSPQSALNVQLPQNNPPPVMAPQQHIENVPSLLTSPSIIAQKPVPAPKPHNPIVAIPSPPSPPPPNQVQPVQRAPLGVFDAPSSDTADAPQRNPSLEISSNTHTDKPIYPLIKPIISIGRHPSNDIVIDEPIVSAFHAQIVREGERLIFIHPHPQQQRTTNGLLYMGRSIAGNEPFRKPLERGDIFRIGDEHGTLVTLAYNDGTAAAQETLSEIRPIPLGALQISIGRLPDNVVVLNHPQVSSHHARLELVQGGYRIVDLHSTNGVYINAQRVPHQLLNPGDEVRIGPFKLTYTGTQLTQYDESNSVRIDALVLKKMGNKHTVILNDISLAIPPRKFVALVGGSGAGKSTLMDALNGLRPAQEGKVFYNGQDYYKHLAAFSTQLGYVPQDDIIHRDLTVERVL